MPRHDIQKVILITGTSSGFGLLTAARLSAKGHFIYATMRDLKKQQPLLDEVAKLGGQVFVEELDVIKPATIIKTINAIKERHGHIDVVINNAGFGLGGFFEDLSDEEIRRQMEVNFFGVQNVCRQIVPLMRGRKQGLIINISSLAGLTATPCLSAYNASKWALEGFSESLYYELAPFSVKVVIVEPGTYPTKIFSDNAGYGKDFNNPKSPYYEYSRRIKYFVDHNICKSKRDPEDVACLIEKIILTANPKLRYISDWQSQLRVMTNKILPPSVYNYIFQKVIYGHNSNSV